MEKLTRNIRFQADILIIAVFLTAYLLLQWFGKPDFALNNFTTLYISQATQEGIDVTARINLFISTAVCGALLFPGLYMLMHRLTSLTGIPVKKLKGASTIACTGIFLIISEIMGLGSAATIDLLLVLFLGFFVIAGIRAQYSKTHLHLETAFYLPVLVISFLLFSTLVFLFNSSDAVTGHSITWYTGLTLLTATAYLLLQKYTRVSLRRLFWYTLPLALAPVFFFAAIEALFFVKATHDHFIHYKWWFIAMMLAATLIFLLINIKRRAPASTRNLLGYFFAPAALLSYILFTVYTPVQKQPAEVFELANPANAVMNMFAFGKAPFIDYMSSHMFSEQFYGAIYNAVFGYDGSLDFLSYKFLYEAGFLIIAYYFFYKLFKNPVFALLFVAAFPLLYILLHKHLFYGVMVFFAIQNIIRAQTTRNYLVLIGLSAALILWRLDTGVATLLGAVVFLPLSFFMTGKKFQYRACLNATVITCLGLCAAIVVIVMLRSPEYLLSNFKTAYHYVSASQAHGYARLLNGLSHQFYTLHFILPAVAVLSVLFITYTIRKDRETFTARKHFMLSGALFLYIIFLTNFQRGLVRHGFMEGLDTFLTATFYLATALFILSFLKIKNTERLYQAFFSISFILIVLVKFFPLGEEKRRLEKFFTTSSLVDLDGYFNDSTYEGRITGTEEFAKQNYMGIKQFMDSVLTEGQTFLDFSNTPMLYYYCQREVPAYFCQNLQNTVDDYLQLQHLKNVDPAKVPVVVYSNYPPNWFDETDGVPNEMRHYLIAEYIYRNYRPYGVLNNHSTWLHKKLKPAGTPKPDTLCTKPATHHYMKAALAISKHFHLHNQESLELMDSGNPVAIDTANCYRYGMKQPVQKCPSLWMEINLHVAQEQNVKVELMGKNKPVGISLFTAVPNQGSYMIRLSNHYLWHTEPVDYIRIYPKKEIGITNLAFYKDKRR